MTSTKDFAGHPGGLYRLCAGIQAEISHKIHANLYYTPTSSQALPAHCDDHDVIILQMHGEKEWSIFDRYPGPPPQKHVTLEPSDVPIIETTLKVGDSLYVPAGFVHSVAATNRSSLHVTLGIYQKTVADLLRYAVDELAGSPVMSRSLEPGFALRAGDLTPVLLAAANSFCEQLASEDSLEETVRRFCHAAAGAKTITEVLS